MPAPRGLSENPGPRAAGDGLAVMRGVIIPKDAATVALKILPDSEIERELAISAGDLGEDGAEIGFRIDARSVWRSRSATGCRRRARRPCQGNRTVIVPISGRMSLFTILGIRCLGGVRAALWVSSGQRARSSISS
jgi:hypothetical protein